MTGTPRSPVTRFVPILLLMALAGCRLVEPAGPDVVPLDVPPGFGPVPVPSGMEMTPEIVRLGERLFFDPILSGDRTVSCGSCHLPDLAFSDGEAVSVGIAGRRALRNSPSLVNVAYAPRLFHDGGAATLEGQVIAPMENPDEMDADLGEVMDRLAGDPGYAAAFVAAFGEGPSLRTMTRAIAAFERTIRSGGSRYDRFVRGDAHALTPPEQRGLALFEGRGGCRSCHAGALFTSFGFEHNGLTATPADSGRARITLDPADHGRFRVPSLRNVARTGPWMHDGRLEALSDVIDHYDRGGDGARGQDPRIRPLSLTSDEKADLEAFLRSLDDETIRYGADEHS